MTDLDLSEQPSDDADAARRAIRLAAFLVLGIIVAGLGAIPIAGQYAYRVYSLFYGQFADIEWPQLLISAAFVVSFLIALRRRADEPLETSDDGDLRLWSFDARWLAIGVVLVVWFGVRFVFRSYAFTDDEYSALFQAQIFAHGNTSVAIPPQWCPFAAAITPTSIASSNCTWRLGFLPLHSLFRAPFIALHLGEIGGAVTAALSLLLVVSIARKQWPAHPNRAWLAGLFFATSTQVLFMSMTFFSMPTHLLFSLAWLWLYVDNRRVSLFLLPWMGFLAIGVHSPFPHGYFAFFFLLRYARDRRFALCVYVAAVYAFALLFWHGFLLNIVAPGSESVVATASATAAVATHLFSWPPPAARLAMAMHLALVVTWASPIVIVLVAVAMVRWSTLDTFSRDAALGIMFVVLARTFISPTPQGVGWGYRYIHDSLGTMALLASVGAESAALVFGGAAVRRWILAATAVVIAVQLPQRFANVEQIVGPYRRASDWLASQPYDAVVFMPGYVPWGRQLIRNDPYFHTRPLILDGTSLRQPTLDSIRARQGSVHSVTIPEMKAAGFHLQQFRIGNVTVPLSR